MREPAGSRPPGILILPPLRLTFGNIVGRSRLWIGGILLGAALCLAPACGDDDEPLPDVPVRPTPEPEPTPEPAPADTTTLRCLAIRADWSEALAEATIPGTYRLRIGEESLTADARILYMYSDSIAEGPYALLAYNKPEGITLGADSVATIDRTEDGQLTALPGYLFAADTTVTVATGDTADVTLAMRRLVHPITLTLRFSKPAKVARMEATLSGLITAIRLPDGVTATWVALGAVYLSMADEVDMLLEGATVAEVYARMDSQEKNAQENPFDRFMRADEGKSAQQDASAPEQPAQAANGETAPAAKNGEGGRSSEDGKQ